MFAEVHSQVQTAPTHEQMYTISPKLFNSLNPHDALKHHFTSSKTHLASLQLRVLKRKKS